MTERRTLIIAGLVSGLVMVGILGNGLVYDAVAILIRDHRLTPPVEWLALVNKSYWVTGLWRPLTLTLLGLQVSVAGVATPVVFHAVSLLMYTICTAMVVKYSSSSGATSIAALLAGILFAAHPAHVEVVASVVGQAEMLTAIAMLAGVLVWHRATTKGFTVGALLALLLAQAAAIGAKEQGFVFPLLLLGQYFLLPKRMPLHDALRLIVPVGLLAMLLLLVRAGITGSIGGETPTTYLGALSTPERLLTVLVVVPEVLRLLIWPFHLQGEYGPPQLPAGPPAGVRHLIGAAMVVATIVLFFRWKRVRPVAALGIWWIVICWLPASSILTPAGTMIAERLVFLPTIGATLIIGSFLAGIGPQKTRAAVAAVGILSLTFAIRSIRRTADWRSPEVFFSRLVEDAPNVYRSWYVAGINARDSGRVDEAVTLMNKSLSIWNTDPTIFEELGQLLRSNRRCAEAIPILRSGLALDPERVQMRAKLGECLLTVGDSAGARAVAREGIARGQGSFGALERRATSL